MTQNHLHAERRAIHDAALKNAAFDGWNSAALAAAAQAAGYDEMMAARAFPGGTKGLLAFHTAEMDRLMVAACAEHDLKSHKIRERIAMIIRLRLELVTPYREAIRRAIICQMLPLGGGRPMRSVAKTVDLMWRLAGDDAVDFNWYTKRALLAGVYSSTLIFWLNDHSDDQADSWAFLSRRIDDIMKIQRLRGQAEKLSARIPNPWRLLGRLRHRRSAALNSVDEAVT